MATAAYYASLEYARERKQGRKVGQKDPTLGYIRDGSKVKPAPLWSFTFRKPDHYGQQETTTECASVVVPFSRRTF